MSMKKAMEAAEAARRKALASESGCSTCPAVRGAIKWRPGPGGLMCVSCAIDEAVEAGEDLMGWCPDCEDWTRDMTEPDARGYECPDCGSHTVIGGDERALDLAGW